MLWNNSIGPSFVTSKIWSLENQESSEMWNVIEKDTLQMVKLLEVDI